MFQTRVTEMLGIEHPIIMGGMGSIGRAELVAAVSNAGGLGIIGSITFTTGEELRQEIHKTRKLTDKPFGVNITRLPAVHESPWEQFVNVVVEERVPMVETSGSSPQPFIERLKKANVKVIQKVGVVKHARSAERLGCDAVFTLGFEGAGHPTMEDVTMLNLLPRMVDAVNIPVIACGGIADARQFLAALAMGAEGVMMGTRFMLTKESLTHPNTKKAMVEAKETDTMIIQRSIGTQTRVLRNKHAEKVLEMEGRGASLEELLPVISGELGRNAMLTGDVDSGILASGQGIGLINEMLTVKEVIDNMINGAAALLKGMCYRWPLPTS